CYGADDILWSHRFVDIVRQTSQGHQYVDYTHFHRATPIEQ
ncbi:MAG: ATP-sensitive inward rectifier potassium channel 10, partial [Cyanobacteria bacterium P01_A01_bin.83]